MDSKICSRGLVAVILDRRGSLHSRVSSKSPGSDFGPALRGSLGSELDVFFPPFLVWRLCWKFSHFGLFILHWLLENLTWYLTIGSLHLVACGGIWTCFLSCRSKACVLGFYLVLYRWEDKMMTSFVFASSVMGLMLLFYAFYALVENNPRTPGPADTDWMTQKGWPSNALWIKCYVIDGLFFLRL